MTIEMTWLLVEGVLLLGALIWLGVLLRLLEKQSDDIATLVRNEIGLIWEITRLKGRFDELEKRIEGRK